LNSSLAAAVWMYWPSSVHVYRDTAALNTHIGIDCMANSIQLSDL